jgi:hypothetical protein
MHTVIVTGSAGLAKLAIREMGSRYLLFASMCGWKNTSVAEIIGVMATKSQRTVDAVEIRNGLEFAS